MTFILYYSSLKDFGISGSKNMNAQYVDAPDAKLEINPAIESNKKFIAIPPVNVFYINI